MKILCAVAAVAIVIGGGYDIATNGPDKRKRVLLQEQRVEMELSMRIAASFPEGAWRLLYAHCTRIKNGGSATSIEYMGEFLKNADKEGLPHLEAAQLYVFVGFAHPNDRTQCLSVLIPYLKKTDDAGE